MKRKICIFFLFIALGFSSCGNFESIDIKEPKDVKVQGFENEYLKLNVKLPISNPSIYKIKLLEADLKVYLKGKYIGKLIIDETIVIKAKSDKVYDLPVKIRVANIFNTAFIMMSLKQGQQVEVRFEGTVTGKSMLLKRTVEFDETQRIKI